MDGKTYDVIGVGNAIVDIIARCDDAFLERHGAPKSHMRLIDSQTMDALYKDMGPAIEASGGSASNTMVGLTSFGGTAAFIGKIADDELGRIFAHDIRAAGVTFNTKPVSGSEPTARSLILVTPDGERTMNTSLGISSDLDNGEIEASEIAKAKVVYLEGYLFDRPEAKAAFREATKIANGENTQVALTLSDGFCVDRHRDEFLALIKDSVDILFANEAEILSLYQTEDFDTAVRHTKQDTTLAALTRSSKGSLILSDGQSLEIPVEPVSTVVDSTGAGDLYAAGFLFGHTHGLGLEKAGRLGSLAAAEIISHMGARPETQLSELAKSKGLLS
ncbi:MAG: adenosine kinase [Pseudomonadota bacterium]